MDQALDHLVRARARNRCEYCSAPQNSLRFAFAIDHIIARQHRGETAEYNLALACGRCNSHKGPNIAGIDPLSSTMCRLFNPRTDAWHEHFRISGPRIQGLTDVGRTTVDVLAFNDDHRLVWRQSLIDDGAWPSGE
jgi:hypothetical protein